MSPELIIFQLVVLIFSVIIHEVSHGAMANHLGDPTAKMAGRLSLNPLKHLDFFGSFLVPLFLWFFTKGNFVFGWAKPVPINPYNLKDQKYGQAKVAAAGPAANFLLAAAGGLILRFLPLLSPQMLVLGKFLSIVVIINILLGVFNLVPIPPLDGSRILFTLLPQRYERFQQNLERYGFLLVVLFILLFSNLLFYIIALLYQLLVGNRYF